MIKVVIVCGFLGELKNMAKRSIVFDGEASKFACRNQHAFD